MARHRYRSSPDGGVLEVDRASDAPTHRRAGFIDPNLAHDRALDRAGARDLDEATEQMPGLTRARRDLERAMPRDTTAPLGHPLKQRHLPGPATVRQPLSSRQRKVRSVTRRSMIRRMPRTEHAATQRAITDPDRWRAINDDLSAAVGDAQNLGEERRVEVQRIDRAIQRYEQDSDRGHVVYANLEMPSAINHGNLAGFLSNEFSPGDVVEFDRYTGAAHNLHQIEPADSHQARRIAVLEIATRRGIYLGRSDTVDNTSHLLPRGMRLRVVDTHLATYRRPDGSTGQRHVIQLTDSLDDPGNPGQNR